MSHVVADVGNSRVKLVACSGSTLTLPVYAYADPSADDFARFAESARVPVGAEWAVATTCPPSADRLLDWIASRGDRAVRVARYDDIPLAVDLPDPGRIGIDRLLNALAALRRSPTGIPLIIVGAGTAVTVDWVDEFGRFRGGSISPGLRMMARSLRDHTAKLPLVDLSRADGIYPGRDTESAIATGVMGTWLGGIDQLVRSAAACSAIAPRVFLTGGDMTPEWTARLPVRGMFESFVVPTLTLEGIAAVAFETSVGRVRT